MRIVYIVQRLVYPPDAGTPIRNYSLIIRAARDHEVHAFGFTDEKKYPQPLERAGVYLHLLPTPPERTRWQRLTTVLTSALPDMAHRSYSEALVGSLKRQLASLHPEIVQVQALDMAYTIATVRTVAPAAYLILDQHNAEYILQRRALAVDARSLRRWPQAAYSLVQWLRLRSYERSVCNRCDLVLAVSAKDAQALRRLGLSAPIAIVPNGIDLPQVETVVPEETVRHLPGHHFVFPGKMDYRPNVDAAVWFAQAVFPEVRKRLPQAHLWLVGRQPHPSVAALANQPGIHVTGEVLDVWPYIAAATAIVAPLRMGAGTKLKVLEAAALCKPLIATSIGAEGYAASAGRDFLLADSAAELAEACVNVANDPHLAARLGANAHEHLARPLNWDRIYQMLQDLYERPCGG